MEKLSLDRHLSSGMLSTPETPRSPNGYPDVSGDVSANLVKVCQGQLTQLVEQLPLLGAWLVYCDRPDPHTRHRLAVCCEDRPGFDSRILSELESELESERWLGVFDGDDDGNDERNLHLLPQYLYFYSLAARGQYCSNHTSGQLVSKSPKSTPGVVLKIHKNFSLSSASLLPDLPLPDLPLPDLLDQVWPSMSNLSNFHEYMLLWASQPLSPREEKTLEQRVEFLHEYLIMGRDYSRQKEKIQLLELAIGRSEHQLRNYLAMISLYSENLHWGLADTNLKEQARIIGETVRNMSQNLNELLNLNGKDQEKKAYTRHTRQNFHQILERISQIFADNLLKKQVNFIWKKDPILFFDFEPWQIEQVFENLLSNAIEFSPPGGMVNCEWKLFRNEVMIKLSDRGPGFSAASLKNAFNPYYSERPGGTGLGLAIAKKIILDHKGSIWLENLPEGGGQVTVVLPRYSQ